LDSLKAQMAAMRSLVAYGLAVASAEEIVARMVEHQPDEWERTLQRCAREETSRIRLFVVWNDIRDFTTFLYSGDKEETVAYLFRTLGEVTSGAFVNDIGSIADTTTEVEGYNKVSCFDIGREVCAAVR
jgi:hypothetical protein